jgi:hypothetical protein
MHGIVSGYDILRHKSAVSYKLDAYRTIKIQNKVIMVKMLEWKGLTYIFFLRHSRSLRVVIRGECVILYEYQAGSNFLWQNIVPFSPEYTTLEDLGIGGKIILKRVLGK